MKFLKLQSFVQNQTFLNLELKVPCLGSFRLILEKSIITFEINTFIFVQMQKFMQYHKKFNLGQKNALEFLGCSNEKLMKTIFIFEISILNLF